MVIERLIEIQKSQHLTNQQMAEKLGLHYTSWHRFKSGRVSPTDKFLVRAHRAFPELGVFLSDDATKRNHPKSLGQKVMSFGAQIAGYGKAPDNPETSPSQNLGRLWSKAVGFLTGRLKPPLN